MIPPEIEGIPTDIIELAPTGWVADRTAISELHPAEQLRRLGLQTKPPKIMAATSKRLLSGTPKGASEWTAYAYPARDQGNCGACTAHGNCKVWETKIRIVANNPVLGCQLSVAHLFFCTPGASCENGSTVDAILDSGHERRLSGKLFALPTGRPGLRRGDLRELVGSRL